MTEKAKILIFDLEVSTLRVETETYSLKQYSPYLPHSDITRNYAIHGAAWKWLGDEYSRCISVSHKAPFNDEAVVRELYKHIDEAHIVVGHNVDRFDLRKFNTRAMYYGLNPLGKKNTVDTLKLARKHGDFPSNSLAYLARFFDVGMEKDESPDWEAIRAGCPDALAYMREYNKRDVDVTERVYLKLRSFDHNPPNVAAIQDVKDVSGNRVLCCRYCGSPEVKGNGSYFTKNGIRRQTYKCKICNGRFVEKRIRG